MNLEETLVKYGSVKDYTHSKLKEKCVKTGKNFMQIKEWFEVYEKIYDILFWYTNRKIEKSFLLEEIKKGNIKII